MVIREPLLVVDRHEITGAQAADVHLVVRVPPRRVDVDDAMLDAGDLHGLEPTMIRWISQPSPRARPTAFAIERRRSERQRVRELVTPGPPREPTATIGVIGVGVMGAAYARRLHDRGYRVLVYDIDAQRAGALAHAGCEVVDVVASLLPTGPHAILLALPSDDALLQAVEHLCRAAAPTEVGLPIVVDTGTSTPDTKERCREQLAAAGMTLLDCPVSGTGAQASDGDLVMFGQDRTTPSIRASPCSRRSPATSAESASSAQARA